MRKWIILGSIVLGIVGFLFWSPGMAEEGGEDTARAKIQEPLVRAELDTLTEKYSCSATNMAVNCCDGMSTRWSPFGRMVEYCEYGEWYVPFWKGY